MSEEKRISRKDFLKGVGVTVAGVAATTTLGTVLTGCSAPAANVDTSQKPEWPFKYKKLDPAVAEERAFKGYKEKGG